jgi:DNA helicase-2/ATP-dependent DNA helicase PcrA
MAIELNPRQRQAVEHVHGPMLVLAGAGTGKTTVLVNRIARLIAEGHARAEEILAITYTDNAAAEMRKRVAQESSCDVRACTFHAYCFGILERCGRKFGLVEKEDLWVYLRRRLRELPLRHFLPARNPAEFLDALLAFFERCHDELITPDKYDAYVARLRRGEAPLPRVSSNKAAEKLSREDVVARCAEIAAVFRKVEEMLCADHLGTYGHMISGAIALLRSDAALRAREQASARFILIDEFQDANVGQIELAALLAGTEPNVFAVGDPDQAIYRFRGASSAAFDEFRRRFPRAQSVVLNDNQRSTAKILDASFFVISKNPPVSCRLDAQGGRFERERLRSARERHACAEGKPLQTGPVEIVLTSGDDEEAAHVATALEKLTAARGDKLDCAVLYRAHAHRDVLAKELAHRRLPFTVRGLDALDTGDVRDMIACLRAIQSARDNASLFRVATLPVWQLDAMRVREELQLGGRDPDVAAALKKVPGGERVLASLAEVRAQARAADMDAAAVVELAIRQFRLPLNAPLAAFRKFVADWQRKAITRTGKLDEFLQYLDFFCEAGGGIELPEAEARPGAVRLMTVHAAKGLEFEHVFVLRGNSGRFPMSSREPLFEFPNALREISREEGKGSEIHKEEERRLFYVAMTRAKDALTICARPGTGRKDPSPAGFLRDLINTPEAQGSWRSRPADATVTLHAGAHPVSALGEWLQAPPALPLTDVVLSATAIQIYKECPLEFKIRREWNLPGEVAAGLHYGNAVHLALKDFYDALRMGRPRTEGELLQCFRDALAAMHFDDGLQRRLYEVQGIEQLSAFFARAQENPPPDVVSTERTFEIVLAGVRVRGRVDRIDRLAGPRVALTDYKTGSPRTDKDADQSLQLSIYALACRAWQLIPERLIFYNLETNEPVFTTRTESELKDTVEEVQEVAAGIAAGDFHANHGYHCRWCAYRGFCPETEEWFAGKT